MGFIAKLKGFDAHAKPQAHLTKKTAEGGLVSLVGFALMAVLFLSELFAYMVPKRVPAAEPRRPGREREARG